MKMFRYGLVLFLVIFGAESKPGVLFRRNGLPEYGLPLERSDFQTVAINAGRVTQKVDNSKNAGATWENRYFETTTFFKPSGPVFVMLPGEMNAASYLGYLNYGLMAKIANDSGAYMALLEHRYYGDSVPNNDLSTENLRYLTEEQALGDAENFIRTLKSKPEYERSKVVVFGGSYGGILAARMRIEHPELVDAAVSSSAPLRPVVAFTEYLEKFQVSLKNDSCARVMTKSFTRLEVMFDKPDYHAKLEKDFRFCQPIARNSTLDRMAFFEQLIVMLSSQVQYGYPQKIKDFCSVMCLPTSLDDYSRLVNFVNDYMHQQHMDCFALYEDYISEVNSLRTNNLIRPWLYQQCNQMGDLITTGSSKQPFLDSIPMTWWENVCSEAFDIKNVGDSLEVSTRALRKSYGGSNPDERFTKIVSTQGSLDPWSTLGLESSPGEDAPLFVIQGVAHCMDLAPDTDFDPEPLKTARANVRDVVLKWLS